MPQALSAELWAAVRMAPAETLTSPLDKEPEVPEAAQSYMRAVALSPTGGKAYRDLARALAAHDAHPTTRVAVLAHAEVLNPFDTELQFEHTNARFKELELHLSTPNRSRGEGSEHAIRELRLELLRVLRRLALREHGRYVPSLHNSLGLLLHQLHKRAHTGGPRTLSHARSHTLALSATHTHTIIFAARYTHTHHVTPSTDQVCVVLLRRRVRGHIRSRCLATHRSVVQRLCRRIQLARHGEGGSRASKV